MKLKTVIILFTVLIFTVSCSNEAQKNKKYISSPAEGIVFSITTFDGKTERNFFSRCYGHTWVSIGNNSGHSLFLKDYEIKDKESVTFSIWAVDGHKGVFFNLEPDFIRQFERYSGRISLSMNISESNLKDIENYINQNDTWKFTKNCSFWSVNLWNQLAEDSNQLKMKSKAYTPKKLKKVMIDLAGEYGVEKEKDFSDTKGIFFFSENKRVEMELCSGKTE